MSLSRMYTGHGGLLGKCVVVIPCQRYLVGKKLQTIHDLVQVAEANLSEIA